jgi:transcriptional regulator with XRE-family HTH domain
MGQGLDNMVEMKETRSRNRATPESVALGRRLIRALERSGKSQSDLARTLDVGRQSIQQLAAGFNANPSASRIFRIADILDCSPRWLALGEGSIERATGESPIEIELLALVRQMPPERQVEVIGFCKGIVGSLVAARAPAVKALENFIETMTPEQAKSLQAFLEIAQRSK